MNKKEIEKLKKLKILHYYNKNCGIQNIKTAKYRKNIYVTKIFSKYNRHVSKIMIWFRKRKRRDGHGKQE